MRVAFVVTQFPVKSETFIWSQFEGLLKRGVEVDVFAGGPGQHTFTTAEERQAQQRAYYWMTMPPRPVFRVGLGVTSYLVGRRPWAQSMRLMRRLVSTRQVADIFESRNYDILHGQFGPNGLTGVWLKRRGHFRGKLVTSFHGFDLTSYLRRWGDDVYRDLFREGDLFLPVADFFAQKLIHLGCSPEKIKVHKMGIELGLFSFEPVVPPEPGEPVRLVSVGRFAEKKGFEYAIQAISILRERRPELDVRYTIVGDGDRRPVLERLIRQLGLEQQVVLPGWKRLDELGSLLRRAHISLAPSVTARDGDQETLPLVIKEAMAKGIPVISTEHGGIPELVSDGETGFLVPERDAEGLADRILFLIDHPERWPRLTQAAREMVEREFDVNVLNDHLLEHYRSVVS